MVTVPQQPLPAGLITTAPTGPMPVYFEGSVGVPDMPTWLKQVPAGAVLQAVVQGRTAANTYSLLTAQGPVTITSALALQPGTQMQFQIGPELSQGRLHLVGGTNPLPPPQPPATAGVGLPLQTILPPAVMGATLNAIVIRPADPAPLPGAPPTPPPAGPAVLPRGVTPQTALAAYAPAASGSGVGPTAAAQPAGAAPQSPVVPSAPAAPSPAASLTTSRPAAAAALSISPGDALPTTAPASRTITPPPSAPAAPQLSAATAAPAPTAAPPVPPPSVAAPAPIPAPVPGTAGLPAASAAQAGPSPAGLPMSPSILSVTQPGEQISLRLVAVTPPGDDPGTGTSPVARPQAPAASPLGFLRDGLASLFAVTNSDPESPAARPATPSLPSGPTLTGTVIGNGAHNRPIIAIGSAIVSLEAAPLPPGTQVQLVPQLATTAPTTTVNSPTAQAMVSPQQSFPTYPSLPALVAAAQLAGGATEQAVLAMLPRLGPQLAASMMIFASGASKGDLRTLVGDHARATLEKTGRGRSALAGAVQEFEAASEEARGGGGADWRAITLPVMTGGALIEPIRLYLHQVSDEEAERNRQNQGGGQRFVLDLDLTHIGPLQIDGLAKQTQLDLVIRTPTPLPTAVRDGIRAVFFDGVGARGVTGGVSFQVGPRMVPDTGQPAVRRGGLIV